MGVNKRIRTNLGGNDIDFNAKDDWGEFVYAKSGHMLCPDFKMGRCDRADWQGRCPYNNEYVHACGICRHNSHASAEHGKPKEEKGEGGKNGGKNKGKGGKNGGKNKGKGGKGGRW